MKRSKKYEKIKSQKTENPLSAKFNDLFDRVIAKGEIKRLELYQALSIRTGIPAKDIHLLKMSDKQLEKVLKELEYML